MADTEALADPDRPCPHLNFAAEVEVNRVGEGDTADGLPRTYVVDLSVSCAPAPDGCGEEFRFTGAPPGLSYDHPTTTPNQKQLHIPIRPASADPDFGKGIPGFSIRRVL